MVNTRPETSILIHLKELRELKREEDLLMTRTFSVHVV